MTSQALTIKEEGARVFGNALVRKALWSGLSAGFAALAMMAARRAAATVWRRATGEEPPVKKAGSR